MENKQVSPIDFPAASEKPQIEEIVQGYTCQNDENWATRNELLLSQVLRNRPTPT